MISSVVETKSSTGCSKMNNEAIQNSHAVLPLAAWHAEHGLSSSQIRDADYWPAWAAFVIQSGLDRAECEFPSSHTRDVDGKGCLFAFTIESGIDQRRSRD